MSMPDNQLPINLLTGISRIDAQHAGLYALIDQLRESLQIRRGNDVIRSILADLRRYTIEHFHDEEKLLTGVGYPNLESQRGQHSDFVTKLEGWEKTALVANAIVPLVVYRFLYDWLTRHILVEDMEYARWIKGRRRAA